MGKVFFASDLYALDPRVRHASLCESDRWIVDTRIVNLTYPYIILIPDEEISTNIKIRTAMRRFMERSLDGDVFVIFKRMSDLCYQSRTIYRSMNFCVICFEIKNDLAIFLTRFGNKKTLIAEDIFHELDLFEDIIVDGEKFDRVKDKIL